MPASKIRADYEQLSQIAQAFGHQAEAAQQMLGALKESMSTLQRGDWVGKGADAFYAEMNTSVLPAIQRLAAAMNSAASATTKISRIMKQAEEDAAALFRLDGTGAGAGMGAGGSGESENGGPAAGISGFVGGEGGSRARSGGVYALKSTIENALNNPDLTFDDLKATIEAASQAERDAVWLDLQLMAKLREKLPTQDYLWLLTALGPRHSGRVKHMTAVSADVNIKVHLQDYVDQAVKDGRKIRGSVSVVGGEDWELAGKAQYGDRWETKRRTLNAFVDDQGRVWVNKDRGNAGTLLHEAVHKYSAGEVRELSKPLNEGVTEYFTRKVIAADGIEVSRTQYLRGYDITGKLIKLIGKDGEAVVARAYFNGDVAGLKQAFLRAGKTEQEWSDFLRYTKGKDWDETAAILD